MRIETCRALRGLSYVVLTCAVGSTTITALASAPDVNRGGLLPPLPGEVVAVVPGADPLRDPGPSKVIPFSEYLSVFFPSLSPAVSGFHLLSSSSAAAQAAPVVNDGGLVNGASFKPLVGAGSIASLFGSELLSAASGKSECAASSMPLPTSLCGTQVLFNGVAVPLFYVNNSQINLQVRDAGVYSVVVRRDDGSSGAVVSGSKSFTVVPSAPGIFVRSNLAAALRGDYTALDLGNALLIPGATITPASYVSLFATGLAPVSVPLGQAAPTSPLVEVAKPDVFLRRNGQTLQLPAGNVLWAGLAPGFAGLFQVNVLVPGYLGPFPGAYEAWLCMGSSCSEPVTVPITRTARHVGGSVESIDGTLAGVSGKLVDPVTNASTPFSLNRFGHFVADAPNASGSVKVVVGGKTGVGATDYYDVVDTVSVGTRGVNFDSVSGLVQLMPVVVDPSSLFDYHPEVKVNLSAERPEILGVWTVGTNPMRIRDFLDWTTQYGYKNGPCQKSWTVRWNDVDVPRRLFVPPTGSTADRVQALQQGFTEANQGVGLALDTLVAVDPLPAGHGLEVQWGLPSWYAGAIAGYDTIGAVSCYYPTQGRFYFDPLSSTTTLRKVAKHEWMHSVGLYFHSPSSTHMFYWAPRPNDLTPFENTAVRYLYKLRNNTKWRFQLPGGVVQARTAEGVPVTLYNNVPSSTSTFSGQFSSSGSTGPVSSGGAGPSVLKIPAAASGR